MDYRVSHQAAEKGRTYADSFVRLPYRHMVWEWEQNVLLGLVQDIRREKGHLKYLDFACGTGRILSLLEGFMAEAHGVDVSEAMLRVAREHVKLATLLRQDLTQDQVYPEHYFDLITAFRFFLNAQEALRESVLGLFCQIIQSKGLLVFNIHMNKGCLLERGLYAYRRLRSLDGAAFPSMSVPEARSLADKFGFAVTRTFHYGVLPVYHEDHQPLIPLIRRVENLFSRFPALLPLSCNVIYVCRPLGGAG